MEFLAELGRMNKRQLLLQAINLGALRAGAGAARLPVPCSCGRSLQALPNRAQA